MTPRYPPFLRTGTGAAPRAWPRRPITSRRRRICCPARAQGGGSLVEAAPGGALLEEVELILADVLGAELVGGAAAVAGEVGDGGDVGADGAGGVVAQAEVVDEPLTEGCHQILLRGVKGDHAQRYNPLRKKAQAQKRARKRRRGLLFPPRSGLVQRLLGCAARPNHLIIPPPARVRVKETSPEPNAHKPLASQQVPPYNCLFA